MRCCSRKHKNQGRQKRRRGGLRTLLFGMLTGLALGLMFAPKPGTETVEFLKENLIRKLPV